MNQTIILGVGGAGIAIAKATKEKVNAQITCLYTDSSFSDKSSTFQTLRIGKNITSELNADTIKKGQVAVQESRDEIEKLLVGKEHVIIAAGLGGATGTGALPILAEIAEELKIRTTFLVTLPFAFEGERRQRAQSCVEKLTDFDITLHCIDLSSEAETAPEDQNQEQFLNACVQRLANKLSQPK